jgi:hypothetical protein
VQARSRARRHSRESSSSPFLRRTERGPSEPGFHRRREGRSRLCSALNLHVHFTWSCSTACLRATETGGLCSIPHPRPPPPTSTRSSSAPPGGPRRASAAEVTSTMSRLSALARVAGADCARRVRGCGHRGSESAGRPESLAGRTPSTVRLPGQPLVRQWSRRDAPAPAILRAPGIGSRDSAPSPVYSDDALARRGPTKPCRSEFSRTFRLAPRQTTRPYDAHRGHVANGRWRSACRFPLVTVRRHSEESCGPPSQRYVAPACS